MAQRRSGAPRPAAVSVDEPASGGQPKSPSPTGTTSRKRKRSPPAGTTSTSRKRASQAGPFNNGTMNRSHCFLRLPPALPFSLCYVTTTRTQTLWRISGHTSARDYRTKDIICLEEFKTFEDKSSAINDTGVNSELTDMIRRCCPWQMLAVGNLKYKRIIETSLDVPCLCNEIVMEVMWGLKNLMHVLVPEEKLKLKKQDRLPMSYGLKKLLDRYGFDVKPRMINEEIVVGSCVVHDSDFCEKKLSTTLSEGGHLLQEVSGINSEGWDLMKLATALKIIAYPPRTTTAETELFTEHEISKLLMDAHKYEGKIAKGGCLEIYKQMVEIRDFRARAKKTMVFLVKEAERAYEAKRRATRKKLYMKLVKEAQSSKRRAKKKVSVKLVGEAERAYEAKRRITSRDESGRKRSEESLIVFAFIFFSRKRNRYRY